MRLTRAGAYPGFYSIKRIGVLLPVYGMLVHRRIPSSCWWYQITSGWREAIEVKQLAQGCKETCQWRESNPWPLDYESKAVTNSL